MKKMLYLYGILGIFIFNGIYVQERKVKELDHSTIEYLLSLLDDDRVRVALNLIAWCEGTSKRDVLDVARLDQYKICFTGKVIPDLQEHPGIRGVIHEARGTDGRILRSSAAGRYQFIIKTWAEVVQALQFHLLAKKFYSHLLRLHRKLNLLYEDAKDVYKTPFDMCREGFGPVLQDLGALYLIYEAEALDDLLRGDIWSMLPKISKVWASIPVGSSDKSYYAGQPAFKSQAIVARYKKAIEEIKKYRTTHTLKMV